MGAAKIEAKLSALAKMVRAPFFSGHNLLDKFHTAGGVATHAKASPCSRLYTDHGYMPVMCV